ALPIFDRSAAALVTLPKELSLHRREPQLDAYYLQRPALSCNGRFVVVTKAHAASTTVSLLEGPGSRIGAVAFSPLCALALVVDEFNVCRLYRLDSTAAHCPPLDTF